MAKRALSELLSTPEPAWPMVRSWVESAVVPVEVLPAGEPRRGEALEATQVTVRSPMGAVIYETGGILVDHGWLRILGSGSERLNRSIPNWNFGRSFNEDGSQPPFLLVADDVVGGFWALDGGGLGPGKGGLFYFGPDTLRWEPTELNYSQFLWWSLTGDLAGFYENLRWPGWEAESEKIGGDQALFIQPPLWSKEGKTIGESYREVSPIEEVYDINVVELPQKLQSLADGTKVRFRPT